ncbi:unnamed protein product [Boreogadus saida]
MRIDIYRDKNKTNQAWKEICEEFGLPDEPDRSWSIGRQHRWPRWESNAEVLRSRKRRPRKHRYMPRNSASEQKSQNFFGLMGKRSFEEEGIRSNFYKKIKLPLFLDILLLQ